MLKLSKQVSRGIMFIRLEGNLDENTLSTFSLEVNNLLYEYGMHYFVFNFKELSSFDKTIFSIFQSKLVEIFLSCGKVVLCGLKYNNFGNFYNKLFYVNDEYDAFKLLGI